MGGSCSKSEPDDKLNFKPKPKTMFNRNDTVCSSTFTPGTERHLGGKDIRVSNVDKSERGGDSLMLKENHNNDNTDHK